LYLFDIRVHIQGPVEQVWYLHHEALRLGSAPENTEISRAANWECPGELSPGNFSVVRSGMPWRNMANHSKTELKW
jgi:hypothetical protein